MMKFPPGVESVAPGEAENVRATSIKVHEHYARLRNDQCPCGNEKVRVL